MSAVRDQTSVMAARASQRADGAGKTALDYFPTPPWAGRALLELLVGLGEPLRHRTLWEPACGEGHLLHALAPAFRREVLASDIHDWRGTSGAAALPGLQVVDFLAEDGTAAAARADWIVTNPPFVAAQAFVETGLKRARDGVALLCRLAFLESVERVKLFGRTPLAVVAPFAERVPMVRGRWDPGASSATAYAWFVWRHGWEGPPQLRFVPPGSRDRLTLPADRAWAAAAPAPLLEDAE